jgi:hypothetical protein
MASPKDAASLVLLCLYCFVSLRLMLTWRSQRGARRQREALTPRRLDLRRFRARPRDRSESDRSAA